MVPRLRAECVVTNFGSYLLKELDAAVDLPHYLAHHSVTVMLNTAIECYNENTKHDGDEQDVDNSDDEL